MGCHNANGLKGDLHSEYTTWLLHDPHARAYEVLLSNKSRSIIQNLQLNPNVPAAEQALCLNCHVHKDYEQASHHPRFAREDGVSCESCHGPASGWISEHYKPQWQTYSPEQKLTLGMWDTRTLLGRARGCTPCHVGAAGMDVTHDLIAAGHPRLAFEFSAYHALIPHHWQDAKDQKRRPDWDAAAWFVGDSVATVAALDLLIARTNSSSWPEYAEYDCYACHHQLQNQSWRQKREEWGHRPGSLPWNDWYANILPCRTKPIRDNASDVADAIGNLRAIMESSAAPDPIAAREQARKAIKALEPWVKQFDDRTYTAEDVASVLKVLVNGGATQKAGSWDEAAQTYLAVVAMTLASRDGSNTQLQLPDVRELLKQIRIKLLFPMDSNSPPTAYTPDELLEPYGLLRKRLGF
jgi:hypothetical protein